MQNIIHGFKGSEKSMTKAVFKELHIELHIKISTILAFLFILERILQTSHI